MKTKAIVPLCIAAGFFGLSVHGFSKPEPVDNLTEAEIEAKIEAKRTEIKGYSYGWASHILGYYDARRDFEADMAVLEQMRLKLLAKESRGTENEISEWKQAIREQEDMVEERRVIVTTIPRFITPTHGTQVEKRAEGGKDSIDIQDILNSKRDYETNLALLQQRRLKFSEGKLRGNEEEVSQLKKAVQQQWKKVAESRNILIRISRTKHMIARGTIPLKAVEKRVGSERDAPKGNINAKLKRIVIPSIDFEDTTIEEAIDSLSLRAKKFDILETDPAKKGVDFVVRKPQDMPIRHIDKLGLKSAPLVEMLNDICNFTDLGYSVEGDVVLIEPIATKRAAELAKTQLNDFLVRGSANAAAAAKAYEKAVAELEALIK